MGMGGNFSGGMCIWLALICLALPLDWILSAAVAAIVHECGHILAVLWIGGKVSCFSIGIGGAKLETTPMEPWQQLLSVLMGPACSFALFSLKGILPKTALCGLIQGAFNLLPVYPLDGGRALAFVASGIFSPKWAEIICRWTAGITATVIFLGAIWLCFVKKHGIMPIFLALFLISRAMIGKIPCKESVQGVQ